MKKITFAGLLLLTLLCIAGSCAAQETKTAAPKIDLSALPGNGLAQHDFLYTGEWDFRKPVQTLFVVHKGQVVWQFEVPTKDSAGNTAELGDATMRANGNIIFCRKVGASEVTPEKKVVWNYIAPAGTEIHSVEPVGLDKVLMVINGVPARVMLINTKTGKTLNEFTIATGKPGPHLQFRRVRMTPEGTILAAHLDSNVVTEHDTRGKQIWSVKTGPPWSAIRLKNGNTLVTTNRGSYISEVDKQGAVVWDISQKDIPGIQLYQLQVAVRLDNGNTIFSNWANNGIKNPADWPKSVQLIEVTPDKKVVWALSQWNNPDMGPASSIQVLDLSCKVG
jgi:hypothetical protein